MIVDNRLDQIRLIVELLDPNEILKANLFEDRNRNVWGKGVQSLDGRWSVYYLRNSVKYRVKNRRPSDHCREVNTCASDCASSPIGGQGDVGGDR